jgi:hypothetical protein
MKTLRLINDSSGARAVQYEPSDYIDYRVLAAGVAETHTVPTGAKWCLAISPADCYIKNSAATVPAADITTGVGPLCVRPSNPRLFPVAAGSPFVTAGAFSIISATIQIVELAFYE